MSGNKNLKRLLAMALLIPLMPCLAGAKIIYVDDDANGLNDGSSWQNAYKYLQDALMMAEYGDQFRVAQGIYKPDQGSGKTPGDREAAFQLINGVTLKGGYAGIGAPDPNARDIEKYETILSGDLNGDDGPNFINNNDNSYHVTTGSHTDATAILDGFVITAGNAEPVPPDESLTGSSETDTPPPPPPFNIDGGGMYISKGSPMLLNCVFRANWALLYGGGMRNTDSSPTLINCSFNGNFSYYGGGGMYNSLSYPILIDCVFSRNWASNGGAMLNSRSCPTLTRCIFKANSADRYRYGGGSGYGGAMYNDYGGPIITKCVFETNSAYRGGALYNFSQSSPNLVNCTFFANSAEYGRALACAGETGYESDVAVTNCILWDDGREIWNGDGSEVTVSYSNIQGGRDGVYDPCNTVIWVGGNIDVDPCFADSNNQDFHLKSQGGRWDANEGRWTKDEVTSLCIDAGDPASPIGYEPFPNDGIINMGAYGGTAEASKSYFGQPVCETIVASDINGDCIINLKDFAIMAIHWLEDH